jgi:hypothetical protein
MCWGVKQLGHDVDHSSISVAEAENEWSYTSPPPIFLFALLNDCLFLNRVDTSGSEYLKSVIPSILESNPHYFLPIFLHEEKLVGGSNPHLSFNHPLASKAD